MKYPKKFSSVSKMAKKISFDFSNDYEKVRAIYTWMTNNITYDSKEFGKYNFSYSTKQEFIKKNKKFNKKLASRVLAKKKAVCEGYSALFKIVCDNLNIKAKIVTGDSKTVITDIGKKYFSSNHAWNIVEIDQNKYLLDVTWGSEKTNNKTNFFYFLTNPKLFIRDHYPNDYKNSLLEEKITKKDFLNGPLFYNSNFQLIEPLKGTIKKGKVIKFKFSSEIGINRISYYYKRKFIEVDKIDKNGYLEFEINTSDLIRSRELLLYFDDTPAIAYRIR